VPDSSLGNGDIPKGQNKKLLNRTSLGYSLYTRVSSITHPLPLSLSLSDIEEERKLCHSDSRLHENPSYHPSLSNSLSFLTERFFASLSKRSA